MKLSRKINLKFLILPVIILFSMFAIVYAVTYDTKITGSTNDGVAALNIFNSDGTKLLEIRNNGYYEMPKSSQQIYFSGTATKEGVTYSNTGTYFMGLLEQHNGSNSQITVAKSADMSSWTDLIWFGADGKMGIGTNNPSSPLYVVGNVSADSFTDRTPFFDGNALELINKIQSDDKGNIDDANLPEFIRKEIKIEIDADGNASTTEDITTEIKYERDLGATITVLIKAIQELDAKLNY